MSLSDIFDKRSIKLNLEGKTKEAVFVELAGALREAHPEFDEKELLEALRDRENKMNTGIASGVAIPHGYCRGIAAPAGALGVSPGGIGYGAMDGKPVHVVFMMIMDENAREEHLRVLNRIFSLVKSEALSLLKSAKSAGEIHGILSRFDRNGQ